MEEDEGKVGGGHSACTAQHDGGFMRAAAEGKWGQSVRTRIMGVSGSRPSRAVEMYFWAIATDSLFSRAVALEPTHTNT
jgi:hypothetical protein